MNVQPKRYSELRPKQRRKLREEYVAAQEGKCMFCNHPLDSEPPDDVTDMRIDWSEFPKGFLDYPVHLQHDHDTDLTEGAVHAYCNAVMWQYHGR